MSYIDDRNGKAWLDILGRTFLVGECNTGAGGEGGPRGIFVLILKNNKFAFLTCVGCGVDSGHWYEFNNRKFEP
jgi:hypothetical protein